MALYSLDLTDKKILFELDCNARQAVSAIAKKAGLSRDIVNYRIKKFSKDGLLLHYFTIIDISKLGYTLYKNFIRFQDMTQEREQEFFEYVKKNPSVVYCAGYDGRFDAVVSLWAKNIEELSISLKGIDKRFGDYLAERQMATIIRGEYCVRDYLLDKKSYTRRRYFFGSVPSPIRLDRINRKILVELGADARAASVEISRKLRLSPDAVYKRIKNLQASGIIQNYNIVPNEETYPFTHYKMLLSLHNINEQKERQFMEFCRENKYVWYFCLCLGNWNLEIDLDVAGAQEFRNFLRELKLCFPEQIKDYTVMTVYKTHKYNFCPSTPN